MNFIKIFNKVFLIQILYVLHNFLYGQTTCISGGMSIYAECNSGQGCTGGCDLTEFSWFGPMCNCQQNSGNCFGSSGSGGQQVKSTIFTINSNCSATLSATFRQRCNGSGCTNCGTNCSNNATNCSSTTGCGNSGMDAGDYFSITGSAAPTSTNIITHSGSPSYSKTGNTFKVTGGSNSGATFDYVMNGPGTFTLEMFSNRSDEIVTFTLQVGSGCSCNDVLPVDVLTFDAFIKNGLVELKWITKNEQHLSHYRIDKSTDGIHFSTIAKVPSENSPFEKTYSIIDDNPIPGITYYKLTPVNLSGYDEQFIMRDLLYQLNYELFTYEILQDDIVFHFHNFDEYTSFELSDLNGKKIFDIPVVSKNDYSISNSSISKGIYLGVIKTKYSTYTQKVVVY
jgi:hypothetical protein